MNPRSDEECVAPLKHHQDRIADDLSSRVTPSDKGESQLPPQQRRAIDLYERLQGLGQLLLTEARALNWEVGPLGCQLAAGLRNEPFVLSDYDPALVAWAKFEYATRQLRNREFPAEFQDGPGWNMLLDLFVQRAHGTSVSVTSACIASLAPPTTALRYLALLERAGWITRRADEDDARRSHLELSEHASDRMREYLARALVSSPLRREAA